MANAFLFEMPVNRRLSFSGLFLFENCSRDFYSKCPSFTMLEIFEMPHFQYQIGKWGISNISSIKKWKNAFPLFSNRKRPENENLRFWPKIFGAV